MLYSGFLKKREKKFEKLVSLLKQVEALSCSFLPISVVQRVLSVTTV